MLLLVSGAVAVSCQDMQEDGQYVEAGDCYVSKDQYVDAGDAYSEAEEWNDCLYNYLTAAREAEKDYFSLDEGGERQIGDNADKTMALKYYNPDTAKVNTCLTNSDYSDLRPKLSQYYDWIKFYATNPVEPPLDIEEEVINKVKGEQKECEELYYFDETMEECEYKEFCGLYMYEGLRTFETNSSCQEALTEFLGNKTEENKTEENKTEGCYCAEYWDPVCGVDGETYSNDCFAECEEVEIAHEGECEENKSETPKNETTDQEGNQNVLLLLGAALGAMFLIIVAAVVIFFLNKGKEDVFVCSECGEEFDSERGLKIHMGKKHKED